MNFYKVFLELFYKNRIEKNAQIFWNIFYKTKLKKN
jgi:hypothetical protein